MIGKYLYPYYEGHIRKRRTFEYLREYESNQFLSTDELHSLQLDKLRRLLSHCEQSVPFYARVWKQAGLHWQDVRSVADLARYPTIDKDLIRANYGDLVASGWGSTNMKKATGGSTGRPFSFEYTRESYERRMAVMMRGYGWAGWRTGARRLDVWGTEVAPVSGLRRLKTRLYDAALGRRVLSCFTMTKQNIGDYVREIDAYRPDVLVGYTGALVEMASWVQRHGGSSWSPRSVITAAEMLTSSQRQLLEASFRAKVFHTYGCREFMLIGAECEHHTGYHVSADHLVVELTDDSGRPVPKATGQVTITDLHNFGMPFVRYLNGDLASAAPENTKCPCGRSLPLLGAVEGRRLDVLTSPDGRIIPGEFFPHLMKDVPSIEAFQVRQTKEDQLKVLLVSPGARSVRDTEFLRSSIEKQVGTSMRVEFMWVDQIPLTPSGKRRVTVREIEAVRTS